MTSRNLQGKSQVYVFHLLVKVGFLPFYEHDSLSFTWYLVAAESRISKKSGKRMFEKTLNSVISNKTGSKTFVTREILDVERRMDIGHEDGWLQGV